eukprot:TRINITY_DN36232_c0_g1_i1.p1 TRINITY_DN36232_c0_g1~~TRINITY_DN36232_c0_g1_i1.p1  ORF type:complete len:132 (+),score=9.28 TRINITY_DN36232_c0_g1_i1:86-481(+)
MGLKTAYLLLFNGISCVGWSVTLFLIVTHLTSGKGVDALYDHIHFWLFGSQTLALLEIVHAATGLVRSNPATTFLQVFSRILLTWGITAPAPPSRFHIGFVLMAVSWSLVEIPRYLFYALKELNAVPYWLT